MDELLNNGLEKTVLIVMLRKASTGRRDRDREFNRDREVEDLGSEADNSSELFA